MCSFIIVSLDAHCRQGFCFLRAALRGGCVCPGWDASSCSSSICHMRIDFAARDGPDSRCGASCPCHAAHSMWVCSWCKFSMVDYLLVLGTIFGLFFQFPNIVSNFGLVLQSYFYSFHHHLLHIFVSLLYNSSSKSLVKILKNTGRISSELHLKHPSSWKNFLKTTLVPFCLIVKLCSLFLKKMLAVCYPFINP